MDEVPERHPAVPPTARWRADLERWETAPADPTGERLLHRVDGSLYQRSSLKEGREEGPFTIFHPSGQVARQGIFTAGELEGDVIARVDAAISDDSVPLRSCCVPPRAVEMRAAYLRGELQFERFYDDAGRLLLSDGRICPARPAGLPGTAQYDEGADRWSVAPAPDASDDLHRQYGLDGTLEEESRFKDGCRRFLRRYLGGEVVFESHSLPDGRREGDWFCRYADGESPYHDGRIVAERGAFIADLPSGLWTFMDASSAVVKTVAFGQPPFADVDDPVFADQLGEAAAFSETATRAIADGHLARGLCAAARAAARSGDVSDLVALRAAHTAPLKPDPAEALSRRATAATEEPLTAALSALMAGGDPAEALRALSGLWRRAPRAALDFAEAALLLAPDRPAILFSRALARLELGEDGGALADARLLDSAAPEVAEFLRAYVKVTFPVWEFWPAQERWGDPVDAVPEQPGQLLPQIRQVMQVYATRLSLIRAALIARAPRRARAPWMPVVPEGVLPEGPLALRHFETTITDETDAGPETIEVVVDETLALEGVGVTGLLLLARRQWAALTWLAWAVGLTRVALPTEIVAPSTFTAGAAAAITRYFRVNDTLQTGGLRARSTGAPSFRFAGADIDELPATIVEIAREETHELRALFLWLLSPENHSPFQSDLREA